MLFSNTLIYISAVFLNNFVQYELLFLSANPSSEQYHDG
ncbi:hypothetical protein GARC_3843 [Paraglaciecola arctica BSs20135]|uniref:Uncharacterized protein n=1 Tax=Paraglaciecola arctica BSs20135 TaxID=493475 RepID=K6YRM8_9ALTE|nr:hypothetical protein GARC_3843 [Paraglaciecola arctica BSs20135]